MPGATGLAGLELAATGAVRDGVRWSYNPWRERPALAMTAAAAALTLCAVIVRLHEPLGVTLALSLAAVATLSPLFVVARCRADEGGVTRGGPGGDRRRSWSTIRRASLTRAGLLVSPATRRHPLDSWRALYLPFPAAGRDELHVEIRALLERHGLAG